MLKPGDFVKVYTADAYRRTYRCRGLVMVALPLWTADLYHGILVEEAAMAAMPNAGDRLFFVAVDFDPLQSIPAIEFVEARLLELTLTPDSVPAWEGYCSVRNGDKREVTQHA
jgi:hypothetical protein